MNPALYPYWLLGALLVCAVPLLATLARGVDGARHRALAMLLLTIAADAAFALQSLSSSGGARASAPAAVLDVDWPALAIPAVALWFVTAAFPGSQRRATLPLIATGLAIAALAAWGDDAIPTFDSPDRPFAFVALAGVQLATWGATFATLAASYRRHRDPFERNRLRYVGLGAVGLMAGTAGIWAPLGDWHLARYGVNALSAAVLGFAVLRYALPDFDGLVRRGVAHLMIGVPTSLLYVGALIMLMRAFQVTLGSLVGLGIAVLLSLGAVAVASYLRAASAQLLRRPFEVRGADRAAHLSAWAGGAGSLRSIEELALALSASCQVALDASFVALLASPEPGAPLRAIEVGGPERGLLAGCSISADNDLLATIAGAPGCTTPFALASQIEAGAVSLASAAEFALLRNCVLAPLVSQGVTVGVLAVGPRLNDAAYRLEDLELLSAVAVRGALSLANAQLIEQLRAAAQTDFITGLPNHRELQEIFTRLIDDATARQEPLTCALVDIDDFAQFNETFGRQSGDGALATVARTLVDVLGDRAVVGRFGGDEFLVLLPGVSPGQAFELLAAMAEAVSALTLTPVYAPPGAPSSTNLRVTWGSASFPEDGATRRALGSVADSQLMQRKFEGRRPASMAARPAAGHLLESDPEKLRVARGLLELIAEKDPSTAERSQQVASLALMVADDLRFSEQERYELWLGSLLHDVGKVGTPEAVLAKASALTPEEWVEVRKHAALGEGLIRGLLASEAVSEIAGCHHERFDGLGYPRGLAGEEIPRMARIVAVADAFSAMVHDRPHTRQLPWPEAMVELRRHAGTQFDPAIVEVFLRAAGRSDFRVAA